MPSFHKPVMMQYPLSACCASDQMFERSLHSTSPKGFPLENLILSPYDRNEHVRAFAEGISSLQARAVHLACARHEHFLPNGQRAGFFLGDGPGVGKGRQIAALVTENLLRKRGNCRVSICSLACPTRWTKLWSQWDHVVSPDYQLKRSATQLCPMA